MRSSFSARSSSTQRAERHGGISNTNVGPDIVIEFMPIKPHHRATVRPLAALIFHSFERTPAALITARARPSQPPGRRALALVVVYELDQFASKALDQRFLQHPQLSDATWGALPTSRFTASTDGWEVRTRKRADARSDPERRRRPARHPRSTCPRLACQGRNVDPTQNNKRMSASKRSGLFPGAVIVADAAGERFRDAACRGLLGRCGARRLTCGYADAVMRPLRFGALSASRPTLLHSHDKPSVQIASDQTLASDEMRNYGSEPEALLPWPGGAEAPPCRLQRATDTAARPRRSRSIDP
jgi:hypothetical protein